jgi:hypothetical protein
MTEIPGRLVLIALAVTSPSDVQKASVQKQLNWYPPTCVDKQCMLIVCACAERTLLTTCSLCLSWSHGMQFGHGFRELQWSLKRSIFVSVILAGSSLSRSKTGCSERGYRLRVCLHFNVTQNYAFWRSKKPENFLASQGRALRAALTRARWSRFTIFLIIGLKCITFSEHHSVLQTSEKRSVVETRKCPRPSITDHCIESAMSLRLFFTGHSSIF